MVEMTKQWPGWLQTAGTLLLLNAIYQGPRGRDAFDLILNFIKRSRTVYWVILNILKRRLLFVVVVDVYSAYWFYDCLQKIYAKIMHGILSPPTWCLRFIKLEIYPAHILTWPMTIRYKYKWEKIKPNIPDNLDVNCSGLLNTVPHNLPQSPRWRCTEH